VAMISTSCKSALLTYSVGRRRIFDAWQCIQRPQQPPLGTDNPHAIRECGYEVRFSVNLWDRLCRGHAFGPLWAARQAYCSTLSCCLKMSKWYCVCRSSTTELQPTMRKKSDNIWTRFIQEVDLTSRADCMAFSVAGCNSGWFYSNEDTWRSTFTRSLQGLSKITGKISSSSDNGRRQQRKAFVRECWAMHGQLSWNGQRPLRSHTVTTWRLWFCHLISRAICWWRVSCKLMPQDIRYTVLSIFLTRIRLWRACAQMLFHPARMCV
jgi:hypothetical protein